MEKNRSFKFIDLFCGIGSFHQAMNYLGEKISLFTIFDSVSYEKLCGLE